MSPAELRARIRRSGFSGVRLAEALGVAQQQIAKWCAGVRAIPEHHVATIIRLTDNPPPRTVPAWRPPANMPPSRSKGRRDKAAQQRHVARKPAFNRRAASEKQAASGKAQAQAREDVDLAGIVSGLTKALNVLAPVAATPASVAAAPASVTKPARAVSVTAATAAGPLHEDFVNQHNAASQRGVNLWPDGEQEVMRFRRPRSR